MPKLLLISALLLTLFQSSQSAENSYHIYIDADFTHYKASAKSIEAGVKSALHAHKNQWQAGSIKVLPLDHRGNTRRSQKNFERATKDPMTLAIFSGIHSPPLLTQRDWINQKDITVLVPWAAAGPITRPKTKKNHIFRLSVDDTKVGAYLMSKIKSLGFKKPFFLFENTGWGKGNHKTMLSAITKQSAMSSAGIGWFDWNLSHSTALLLTQTIEESKADCIIYVGNTNEAVTLFSTFTEHELTTPIFSHWGITGGDFAHEITAERLSQLNLKVLQTRFSDQSKDEWVHLVKEKLGQSQQNELFNHVKLAPTGFFHAHDLTTLLMAALKQIDLGNIKKTRHQKLNEQLKRLETPIQGLIKIYHRPFSLYDGKGGDQHEALSEKDFCLGEIFSKEGISLLP